MEKFRGRFLLGVILYISIQYHEIYTVYFSYIFIIFYFVLLYSILHFHGVDFFRAEKKGSHSILLGPFVHQAAAKPKPAAYRCDAPTGPQSWFQNLG